MAIALDTGNNGGSAIAATSLTYSHTCTGSNLLLIVGVYITSTSDLVSGITYNGVAMTRLYGAAVDASARYGYLYYLLGPATGANNVVVSTSSSTNIYGVSCSWTGVKQSGFPDAQNTVTWTGTSNTTSVTTVVDNCWAALISIGDRDASASTGSTQRAANASASLRLFDSNGPKTPAGSLSMSLTRITGGTNTDFMASFAPLVSVQNNPSFILNFV